MRRLLRQSRESTQMHPGPSHRRNISRAKAQRDKENPLETRQRFAPLRLCARNILDLETLRATCVRWIVVSAVLAFIVGLAATGYAVRWRHRFYHHVTHEELSHQVRHNAFPATIRDGPALQLQSGTANRPRSLGLRACELVAVECPAHSDIGERGEFRRHWPD